MRIIENFDLAPLTTFHLPAQARWYGEYSSFPELKSILNDPRFFSLKWFHMGSGSNLLFTSDFDGLVLHSAMKGLEIKDDDGTTVKVEVESGVVWDDFVRWTIDHDLYGAENLAIIPGEVGASAVQNIGAYGVEVKDIIFEVTTYDTLKEEIAIFSNKQCQYAYRDSFFKHCASRYIVLSVTFALSRTPHFSLEYGPLKQLKEKDSLTLKEVYDTIVDIRNSKLPNPDKIGSAGSFFKNPVVNKAKFDGLEATYPGIPHYEVGKLYKIPAGWLIENAGLKGLSVGKAQVYPKQCLVLVNNGGATAKDVLQLYQHVVNVVDKKYGIRLSPEVNIIR